MKRSLALAVFLAAAAACQNGSGSSSSIWAPTTKPFDETCAHCTELGAGELSHGGDVRVLIDAQTDDPPAQWARCMFSFLRCAKGGGEYPSCVANALCPQPCKDEYARVLAGSADFEQQAAAVKTVFLEPTGMCTSPGQNVPVSP